MKNLLKTRKLFFLIATLFALLQVGCSSNESGNAASEEPAGRDDWYARKEWLHGLPIAPHESVNEQAFAAQYEKDSTYWNEAFNYLKSTDLRNLAPGQYNIDSGNVYAIVSKVMPMEKDSVKWEAHRNFNDLQYIIEGNAKMGVASYADSNAVADIPYDSKTDNANFNLTGEKYYDASPQEFFIFTPNEIHRPAFKGDNNDSVKRIVIKVRVP